MEWDLLQIPLAMEVPMAGGDQNAKLATFQVHRCLDAIGSASSLSSCRSAESRENPGPRVKLQSRVAPVAAGQTEQRLQGPDNLNQGCVK